MKEKLLLFSALFFLMLIAGLFWGTWFTFTRSVESYSLSEFIQIGKLIITNISVPMRIILPMGIILVYFTLRHFKKTGNANYNFGVFSFALIIIVLLISLFILAPIDNQIKKWTVITASYDWEGLRTKWVFFNILRTYLSLACFGIYTMFVFSALSHKPLIVTEGPNI